MRCGAPSAMLVIVAAGNGPSAAARLFVRFATASSMPAGDNSVVTWSNFSAKPGMRLSSFLIALLLANSSNAPFGSAMALAAAAKVCAASVATLT